VAAGRGALRWLKAANVVFAAARPLIRPKHAQKPRLQATKATQTPGMFARYMRPGISDGPHSNRKSVP
jgi:hypothetical protein